VEIKLSKAHRNFKCQAWHLTITGEYSSRLQRGGGLGMIHVCMLREDNFEVSIEMVKVNQGSYTMKKKMSKGLSKDFVKIIYQ